MNRLRYAGLSGALGTSGLTNSDTDHVFDTPLEFVNGSIVPSLSGGDYFMLSLIDANSLVEVVAVTAYDSSTGEATLVRGLEGSTAASHAAGIPVEQSSYPSDLGIIAYARDTSIVDTGTLGTGNNSYIGSVTFTLDVAETVVVSGGAQWRGHLNRMAIAEGAVAPGVQVTPFFMSVADDNNPAYVSCQVPPCPTDLTAGTHTLYLWLSAQGTTASVSIQDRYLIVSRP